MLCVIFRRCRVDKEEGVSCCRRMEGLVAVVRFVEKTLVPSFGWILVSVAALSVHGCLRARAAFVST